MSISPEIVSQNEKHSLKATADVLPRIGLRDLLRQTSAPRFAGDARALLLGTLRLADIFAVTVAAVISYRARYGTFEVPGYLWWQVAAASVICANALHFSLIYDFRNLRRRFYQLSSLAAAWTATMLLMVAIIYFSKSAEDVSRAWMLLWGGGTFVLFACLRVGCWTWLRRGPWRDRYVFNVAIVGESGVADRLSPRIYAGARDEIRLLGSFSDRRIAGESPGRRLDDLVQLARRERIDEIEIAVPVLDTREFRAMLRTLSAIPADIKLWLELPNVARCSAGPLVVPAVYLCKRPMAGWQMLVKRAMDLVIAMGMLLFSGPLLLVILLLVMLDSPGPVIFRQPRFGFNKQQFTLYKFRTMTWTSADPTVPQARRNDPRVTRVGRFLRRTSLDELPQLFNVLAGDMSLVGPRPHAIVHDEMYAELIDGYLGRHRVKPGITGWAQVNGFRGETDTIEKMIARVDHDLFYIEHWSPLLDLRILIRTLAVGFGHPNAY